MPDLIAPVRKRRTLRNAKRPKRNEGGIVLILALFVIFILLVIVPQFRFSAYVEREIAKNDVQDLQMESIARAAIMRAQAALLVDLDDDKSKKDPGAGGADPLGGAGGAAGDGAGGAADGAGGAVDGGTDGSTGSGQHVDSLDEVWADGQLTFTLGEEGGFKTSIEVSDEDSKYNLLLLFNEDDDYRREWRPRFERLLDLMRDGKPEDLSLSEAGDLIDRVSRWMEGDRQDDELATAPLASGDWRALLTRPMHAPLSLAELSLAGGIKPQLYWGFGVGEDERHEWVPGLAQVLTVWSNLEYIEEKKDAKDGTTTPPPEASADTPTTRAEAQGMNNGRVNVNTAPVWILKALFADNEIPFSAWDQYDEFRKQRLEELKQEREDLANATDDEKKNRKKEPEADDPVYPLETIDDLRKVDGFTTDSSSLTPDKWNKLAMFLSVESNVFTITVKVGTREQPRRYYVARAVVWRRNEGGTDARCIPIIPFERLPTSAIDMEAFAKETDEWSGAY